MKPRIEERTKVLIQARLRGSGQDKDACVLDASSRGLLVTTADPPRVGEIIEIIAGDHSFVGQVKWASARRFGIALRDRISVFALTTGDKGQITLKQREAERKRKALISSDGQLVVRRIEFVVFFIAGAVATLIVADYVSAAMHSLEIAKLAMAAQHAS